jgi:hypothetical protein
MLSTFCPASAKLRLLSQLKPAPALLMLLVLPPSDVKHGSLLLLLLLLLPPPAGSSSICAVVELTLPPLLPSMPAWKLGGLLLNSSMAGSSRALNLPPSSLNRGVASIEPSSRAVPRLPSRSVTALRGMAA